MTTLAPPRPPRGAGLTSWMFIWRCSCFRSRRTRCMRSCSGGTYRDARWAGSGAPRQRRCCHGGSHPPRPAAAQETVLAHAIAYGDTAALVEAVRTGHAWRGTTGQHAARSGRVPGGAAAGDPLL